jgi:hypothetical protein
MELAAKDYLEGAAFALATLSACGVAGWIVVVRRLPWLHGIVQALALFVAVTGALVFAHLLPGVLGVLSRWTVLVVALGLAALAWRIRPVAGSPPPEAMVDEADEPAWANWAGALGPAVTVVAAVAFLVARSSQNLDSVDALSTHLPTVARWIQSGSFWQLVQYTPDLSNATYPHNGTLMMLAAVLPWEHTFLARYVDVPFLVAAAVALYAIARELRAPKSASVLAAAAVMCLAAVNEPGLRQAQVDPPMLAWFTIGALFLLRSGRGAPVTETLLAGLGLGLAFGTKWYAVVYVPLLVAAWLWVRRGAWRESAQLVGTIALSGGFWFVRNWVEAGNPVHPAKVPLLFDAPADPLREQAGFTVSDYLFDADIWRDKFIPAWGDNFGILGPILLLAIVVALVVAWRTRDRGALYVAGLSLVMALLYTKLPDTAFGLKGNPRLVGANARYLVPGLMGGAVMAAWLGRRALAPVCALLLAGIVDGVLRSYDGVGTRDVVAAIVLLVAAFWVVVLARRRAAAAVVVLAAVALLLIGAGWEARNRDRARSFAAVDEIAAYVWNEMPPGSRVAIGKTWNTGGLSPVLPSFGPRLDNHVEYLGRFVQGTLRQWPDEAGFTGQVRSGRFDAVILGTGIPPAAGGELPQADWVRALGYTERVRTPRLVLFAR